ncbi:hypothetical protein CapIbe_009808 [Capra ibex]
MEGREAVCPAPSQADAAASCSLCPQWDRGCHWALWPGWQRHPGVPPHPTPTSGGQTAPDRQSRARPRMQARGVVSPGRESARAFADSLTLCLALTLCRLGERPQE